MPERNWRHQNSWLIIGRHFLGCPACYPCRRQSTMSMPSWKRNARLRRPINDCFQLILPGTWNDSCSQGLLFWWFKVQTTLRNRALNEPCLKRRVYIFYIEYEQETGSMFASLGQGLWYDFNLWFKETSPNLWMSSFQVFSFCIC